MTTEDDDLTVLAAFLARRDEGRSTARPTCFIGHVEIPAEVAGAYARLRTTYPEARRDLTPRDGPEGAPRRL